MKGLRKALSNATTATEAAKRAKELASNPANAAMLPEIVAMLADVIITPPRAPRGGQRKISLDDELSSETKERLVFNRTVGNVALSHYAHIVNARNIADGRAPEFAAYGTKMTQAEAVQYLKDRRLYAYGRQGIKRRAQKYALSREHIVGKITSNEFNELKRKLRQHD